MARKNHRKRMPKGKSRRLFKKTASRTHKKNISKFVSRGGIRL